MKTTMKKSLARIFAVVLAICLVAALGTAVYAADINQAVTDAKSGVVQIQVWFVDPEAAVEIGLHSGTGFLINEDTVVTNDHVASGFDDSWYVDWAQYTKSVLGVERTAEEIKQGLQIRISVLRDVYVTATVRTASSEMDYAILTLDEKLYNRTPLALRNTEDLQQTESVYALGFPGDVMDYVDQNYYDVNDVTITSGSVNKVDRITVTSAEGRVYKDVECVESSALITGGNSGGPLVDANGAVVGINTLASDTRNIAITIDQVIDTLDALGISYTLYEEGASAPTEAPVEVTEAPTEAATEAVTEAATEAAVATEPAATEPAAVKESGLSPIVIILIVAVVAVVVIVVVVVLVMGKSKKQAPKQPVAVGAAPKAPAAPVNTGFTTAPPTPAAYVPMDAGETTVLNDGAGETTVLSSKVNGGTLVRKKNGETIAINAAEFVIGRERKSVNYCISDNTSISRSHAKLVVRNGITYLVDLGGANGSFVNGVKAAPRQEVALKNGDKVTLADEELEYKN